MFDVTVVFRGVGSTFVSARVTTDGSLVWLRLVAVSVGLGCDGDWLEEADGVVTLSTCVTATARSVVRVR